jgi:hypothetical protein
VSDECHLQGVWLGQDIDEGFFIRAETFHCFAEGFRFAGCVAGGALVGVVA